MTWWIHKIQKFAPFCLTFSSWILWIRQVTLIWNGLQVFDFTLNVFRNSTNKIADVLYLTLLLGQPWLHSDQVPHGPMVQRCTQSTEQCSNWSGVDPNITIGSFKHSDRSALAPAEIQSNSRTRIPSPHVFSSGKIHSDHFWGFQNLAKQEWPDWSGQGRTSIRFGQFWPPCWGDWRRIGFFFTKMFWAINIFTCFSLHLKSLYPIFFNAKGNRSFLTGD